MEYVSSQELAVCTNTSGGLERGKCDLFGRSAMPESNRTKKCKAQPSLRNTTVYPPRPILMFAPSKTFFTDLAVTWTLGHLRIVLSHFLLAEMNARCDFRFYLSVLQNPAEFYCTTEAMHPRSQSSQMIQGDDALVDSSFSSARARSCCGR